MLDSPALGSDEAIALIAHEEPTQRAFAASLVRSVGMRNVRQAQNGSEALWLLKQENFALAVIDWELGGMRAEAFVYEVRRFDDHVRRRIPIVLLTADTSKAAIEGALSIGVDSYVVKPVAAGTMARRLNQALSNPRPFIVSSTYVGPCRRRTANANYSGPRRRAEDNQPVRVVDPTVMDLQEDDPQAALRLQARALLDTLATGLAAIEARLPNADRILLADVEAVRTLARVLNDTSLDSGAALLTTYLEGPVKFFDEARTHLDALRHLTGSQALPTVQREAVAKELARMAEKTRAKAARFAASSGAIKEPK